MELSKVLERVRKLVALAEHPGTPPVEAERAREAADAMMTQYAIEEAMLDATRPASRSKPGIIDIALAGEYEVVGNVAGMADHVARYCRCKIRHYTRYDHESSSWMSRVWGFESDLRYFEILYTTLRLHMLGALRPTIDPSASLEDNVYTIRNAGFLWPEIADMYGWREVSSRDGEPNHMYQHKVTGERASWNKTIGRMKAAYHRAIKARGTEAFAVPPNDARAFRASAAQGYVSRIGQRLREAQGKRTGGSELALRMDDLSELFRKDNPDLFRERVAEPECEACQKAKSGHCRQHPRESYRYKPVPYSEVGYQRGVSHANSASLSPEASRE